MTETATAQISITDEAGVLCVRPMGRIDAAALTSHWDASAARVRTSAMQSMSVDLSGVTQLDGAGLGLILGLEYLATARGCVVRRQGVTEAHARLLEMASRGQDRTSRAVNQGFLEHIGDATMSIVAYVKELVRFRGELMLALLAAIRNPRQLRWGDTMREMAVVGAHAVPVVALLGFLIGGIIAFQTMAPFAKYGAQLQVADVVGVSILRELGPLITAILVAGRSGAAFAATIGTMKVGQEVDALRTFGIAPMRFLVLPRFVACVCMTPLLAVFADLMGIAGGSVIMMSEGFSFRQYLNEVQVAVDASSFLQGLVKAGVFGALIAVIGCQRGLATAKEDGARAVGDQTTKAVVSSIVMIVIADAIMGVFFYTIGI